MSEATIVQPALLGGATAKDILKVLRDWHADRMYQTGKWAFFPELAISTGAAERRIDAYAVGLWHSDHYPRVAYEIKVSRADWLGDEKWEAYAPLVNQFSIVCPAGVVQVDEVPAGVGVYYVSASGTSRTRSTCRRRTRPSSRG